jgi:hypothetical protein
MIQLITFYLLCGLCLQRWMGRWTWKRWVNVLHAAGPICGKCKQRVIWNDRNRTEILTTPTTKLEIHWVVVETNTQTDRRKDIIASSPACVISCTSYSSLYTSWHLYLDLVMFAAVGYRGFLRSVLHMHISSFQCGVELPSIIKCTVLMMLTPLGYVKSIKIF